MVPDPKLGAAAASRSVTSPRAWCDVPTVEDRLNYEPYAQALADFILHEKTTAPLVIAVQGPWGQGKTSLMRMVEKHLQKRLGQQPEQSADARALGPRGDQPSWRIRVVKRARRLLKLPEERRSSFAGAVTRMTYREVQKALSGMLPGNEPAKLEFATVWFRAWAHQGGEQLWAGLAHCIISQLAERLGPAERDRFWLSLQVDRIDPDKVRHAVYGTVFEKLVPVLFFGLCLVVFVSGLFVLTGWRIGLTGGPFDLHHLAVWVAFAASALTPVVTGYIAIQTWLSKKLEGTYVQLVRNPGYKDRFGSLPMVHEDVTKALDRLVDPKRPAVVFVDDLDRCAPVNVADIVAAINLFLASDDQHCIFVLGMDAEVVAASMEVAHQKIIERLPERAGELGWGYMDKFVQLPIILPRLHVDNQKYYLAALFEAEEEAAPEASQSKGDPIPDFNKLWPFLEASSKHLSYNPRTLKKIVNLFRFHLLLDERRPLGASRQQLLLWVTVLARWPSFVRWIQRLYRSSSQLVKVSAVSLDAAWEGSADAILDNVIQRARMTDSQEHWAAELADSGLTGENWVHSPGLFELLREERDLHLGQAVKAGLW
jgi:hypothetical protein